MARNPFVVGDRLVIDGEALGEIGGRHYDPARALAIRRAGDVMSGSRRLESRNGFDRDWRPGQQREKLWKLGLHLRDVVSKIVQDLFRRSWNVFGIGLEGCAERGEIGEAFLLGNGRHLGFDAIDFAQAQLMNLIRAHVSGGPGVNVILITLLAIGQRRDGERGATRGRIFRAHKGGESFVGGENVGVDSVGNLLRQALLVFGRDASGIFFCRLEKWIRFDDAVALARDLLQEKSHRHHFVLNPGAQDFGGLAENAWYLVKTRDVVLVMSYEVKRYGERQIGKAGVDAIR